MLRRTLDEETARDVQDPEAVRAALARHFLKAPEGGGAAAQRFATAIDMAGNASFDDDPTGSAFWLPLYEAVVRHDSNYRRTAKAIGAPGGRLAEYCARLIGPDASAMLRWFRRASLDGGLAAELVDDAGQATGNGGDASLSGLVAWSVWYAVHALGEHA